MEPNTIEPTPEPATHENRAPAQQRSWARYVAIGAAAVAAIGGIGLVSAMSEGGPRHGWGQHMEFSGKHGMRGFGEHRLEHILEEIDATPEQAEKIKAIVTAAREGVAPLADEFRDTREQVATLLAAPTIDRAAAETMRAERIAKVDEASRKLTTAVLDAAEVLTPAQRAELLEHLKERGKGRRW